MAEIILSQAGAAVGAAALPSGVSVFGQTIAGSAIGGTLGRLAGRAIDASLMPANERPRIDRLHVMESREGAGLPKVYGRMRVGGQVIWASRFREQRRERRAGKGGPKYADYTYSVSFAVALCQGPITRVDKVWANGDLLTLNDVNWRLYNGSEEQVPDPLIEAIEGSGSAPAYRGTAYIVFEDFPLDQFGNRLPQLSFEVIRAGSSDANQLRGLVKGVNIIPASGEFVYGTRVVRERRFPGIETPLNMNNHDGRTDFALSIDQLGADLPAARSAALTVAWFGDSIEASSCRIRPGVETRTRDTVPYGWSVDGTGRGTAHLISQTEGTANYGGTPADTCVIEGIAALKNAGIEVTLSPFLLMDAAGFPWRGRLTVTADRTAQARTEIESFVGVDGGFGFRHFILHHARLAVQAGGVEAFLLGSEMATLTRVRDDAGKFPFVEALIELAAEARIILGPGVKISYAADWTEYGAYAPGDGSDDVLFPLDALWASENIDFVGIDWYPPAGDWRDGDQHLDAQAGFTSADSESYLSANMVGGEAFDWYYADLASRDAQVRTEIRDTAHGEDWIFRAKDLAGWWSATHYPRPGGVRSSTPSSWVPGMKPVRLSEIGFPAVDSGGNAPNLFYDPKSDESALPPYSTGARDDLFQRRALGVALSYWQAQPFIDQALVWAWDGRPWPHFPARQEVWSDGPNWQFGHWLNGRSGLIELAEVIDDLTASAGVSVNTQEVAGFVEGFSVEGVTTLRSSLSALEMAFELTCVERDGELVFRPAAVGPATQLALNDALEMSFRQTRTLIDKVPGRLKMTYISGAGQYEPAIVEAIEPNGDQSYTMRLSLPLVLGQARAKQIADDMLKMSLQPVSAEVSFGPASARIETGDIISLNQSTGWRVDELNQSGLAVGIGLKPAFDGMDVERAAGVQDAGLTASFDPAPSFVVIDAQLPGFARRAPLVGAAATPWLRPKAILAGPDAATLTNRGHVTTPAILGKVQSDVSKGPIGRWDRAAVLDIEATSAEFETRTHLATLNGGHLLCVENDKGWEIIAYREAELVETDRWRLRGLLRGLAGSPVSEVTSGALVVALDDNLVEASIDSAEFGLPLLWKVGEAEPFVYTFENRSDLPWRVGHLRACDETENWKLTWTRRGADIPDSWSLPEAANAGVFHVQCWLDTQLISETVSEMTQALVEKGCTRISVAEIGIDGRVGEWASISVPLA